MDCFKRLPLPHSYKLCFIQLLCTHVAASVWSIGEACLSTLFTAKIIRKKRRSQQNILAAVLVLVITGVDGRWRRNIFSAC